MDAVWGVVGVVVGAAGVWLLLRSRIADTERRRVEAEASLQTAIRDAAAAEARVERLAQVEAELVELRKDVADRDTQISDLKQHIAAEQTRAAERADQHEAMVRQLTELREEFKQTFKSVGNEALDETRTKFFEQAKELMQQFRTEADDDTNAKKQAIEALLKPVHDQLKALDDVTKSIEDKRHLAHGQLAESLQALGQQQVDLQKETTRLVKALQDPGTAGSWGEFVLERVLELAGLEGHWSYDTQATTATEDGSHRPDVVVKLPGERTIVIDSKAPFRAYLDGLETDEISSRTSYMLVHANKLLEHAKVLSKRDYARRDDTIDFTVMFIPSEAGFRAAVEAKPSLIEDAMAINVILTTPTTLLGLLRAVAYGWRQDTLAREAKQVQAEGRKLYESISVLIGHYEALGKALSSATNHYNKFGGSLESTVLPAARRFKEFGISSQKEVADVPNLEFTPKSLNRATAETSGLNSSGQATDLFDAD